MPGDWACWGVKNGRPGTGELSGTGIVVGAIGVLPWRDCDELYGLVIFGSDFRNFWRCLAHRRGQFCVTIFVAGRGVCEMANVKT